MSCLRCEIARAKFIAMGLAGLRLTAQQIADDLRNRYGPAYQVDGRDVVRVDSKEKVIIFSGRR